MIALIDQVGNPPSFTPSKDTSYGSQSIEQFDESFATQTTLFKNSSPKIINGNFATQSIKVLLQMSCIDV